MRRARDCNAQQAARQDAATATIPTGGGPSAAAPWSREAVQEAARIIGP